MLRESFTQSCVPLCKLDYLLVILRAINTNSHNKYLDILTSIY